jgi:ABC-type antimicrobial peptide transport system permease subunit
MRCLNPPNGRHELGHSGMPENSQPRRQSLALAHFLSPLNFDVQGWEGRAQLVGVTAYNPPTLAAAAVLLTVTAAIASWIPTRRAARVDPMVALRYE